MSVSGGSSKPRYRYRGASTRTPRARVRWNRDLNTAHEIVARGLADVGVVHSDSIPAEPTLTLGTDSVPTMRVNETGSLVRSEAARPQSGAVHRWNKSYLNYTEGRDFRFKTAMTATGLYEEDAKHRKIPTLAASALSIPYANLIRFVLLIHDNG